MPNYYSYIQYINTHHSIKNTIYICLLSPHRHTITMMFSKLRSCVTKPIMIAFLFFSILLALTTSTVRYRPYSKETNYAKYQEGMTLSPALVSASSSPSASSSSSMPPSKDNLYSVPSFNGLYMAPGTTTMIDQVGVLKSSKSEECSKESNLSTSGGFVCLSNEVKQSLASRGGNA